MILIGACVSAYDFRNNEKRKEKSRDAARTRRTRETEIFSDLGEALPLSKEEVEQLDKASVMRLAIAYLKVRDMVDTGEWELRSNDSRNIHQASALLRQLFRISPHFSFISFTQCAPTRTIMNWTTSRRM